MYTLEECKSALEIVDYVEKSIYKMALIKYGDGVYTKDLEVYEGSVSAEIWMKSKGKYCSNEFKGTTTLTLDDITNIPSLISDVRENALKKRVEADAALAARLEHEKLLIITRDMKKLEELCAKYTPEEISQYVG